MHNHYIPFLTQLNFSFAQFPISLSLFISAFSSWIEKPQNKIFYVVKHIKLSLSIGNSFPLDVTRLVTLSPGCVGWCSPGATSALRLPSSALLWWISFFLTLYPTLSWVAPSSQWILFSCSLLKKDVQEVQVLRSCTAEAVALSFFLMSYFILEDNWFTVLC